MALVAEAVIVTGPTVPPVTSRDATPFSAVADPVLERVPVPDAENVTEALLEVRTERDTSLTSATKSRFDPDGSGLLDDVMTMWYGWIVNEVEPFVTVELYEPVIVGVPPEVAVTAAEIIPAAAVTVVSPETPPVPDWASVIGVVESSVIIAPTLSLNSAVNVRENPAAIAAVLEVK
jgi:hypothetical protein